MPRKKGQGVTGEGIYWRPHPVDFAVLERLPREGTMLGWHVISATAKGLLDELNEGMPKEGRLTINELSGRLVSMQHAGLVLTVPIMGKGKESVQHGWQRTKKGEAAYAEHTGKSLSSEGPPAAGGSEGGGK